MNLENIMLNKEAKEKMTSVCFHLFETSRIGKHHAAAKSLQSCPTLCDPRDGSPPGKNTRVGCHFLLQCMKVKSESEVTQSCPTLSDPIDCSLLGSSIHGIFQARVLEWGAIAFSEEYWSGLLFPSPWNDTYIMI